MEDNLPVLRRMIREAYLALSPEEEEKLAGEVAGLLDNVAIIASLPPAAGAPRAAVGPAELRADDVEPSLALGDALANAPDTHDGFVAVPKVIGAAEGDDTI